MAVNVNAEFERLIKLHQEILPGLTGVFHFPSRKNEAYCRMELKLTVAGKEILRRGPINRSLIERDPHYGHLRFVFQFALNELIAKWGTSNG